MKKIILIILMFSITGCGNSNFGEVQKISDNLKLKVDSSKIIESKIIKDENFVDIVRYDYISDKEVSQSSIKIGKEEKTILEDISKRTVNSQHFKINDNEYQARLYSGSPFYKEADKWYQVETATTTIDAFEEQNKISFIDWIKKIVRVGEIKATNYYAGAGDGRIYSTATTWSATRAKTSADGGSGTSDIDTCIQGTKSGSNYYISRSFYPIDTSSLGAGATVSDATFYVYRDSAGSVTETTNKANMALVGSTQADPTSLSLDDFDQMGTTRYCDTDVLIATFNASASYQSWILNSTGISNINVTGYTLLGIKAASDFSDLTAPTAVSQSTGRFSEYTGTSYDPYISITYTPGASSANLETSDLIIIE